jgi:hypothetical protein
VPGVLLLREKLYYRAVCIPIMRADLHREISPDLVSVSKTDF